MRMAVIKEVIIIMDNGKKVSISIIIPAYNCEQYIEGCIRNILDERLQEVEIIVVNDGSTDRTKNILRRFSGDITVISKPNGGVSSARNMGMENANGEYITFLDADDEIPKGIIARYLDVIKNNINVELIQGCFEVPMNPKGEYEVDSMLIKKVSLGYPRSLTQYQDITYEVKAGTHGCYGKLFNSKIIKDSGLKFNEKMGLGEDLLFYFDYLSLIKKVVILENQTYKINCGDGSATRSLNEKMPQYALAFSKVLLDKVNEGDELYPEAMYQINMHVNKAISCWFFNPLNTDRKRMKKFKIFLKDHDIHMAYELLDANEQEWSRRSKYWLLKNRYVYCYCMFEKIYNSFITCRRKK